MTPMPHRSRSGPLRPLAEQASDVDRMLGWVGFGARAVRRRWLSVLLVFVATGSLVTAALAITPRTYRVQTRVLTHRSYLIPALVSPQRAVPAQADSPTRGAVELIQSRDNLEALIAETDLLTRWWETRSFVGRLKDAARELVLGPLPPDEMLEAVLATLDERFLAYVEGDVIVMQVDWHDADDAVRIAGVAQRRFLQQRKETELREINETVRILSRSLVSSRAALDQAMASVQEFLKGHPGAGATTEAARLAFENNSGPTEDERASRQRLERQLRDVRADIAALERDYKEELIEAQQALTELRASLGPEHPDIRAAVRVVEERSRAPAALGNLKAEEAELSRQSRRFEREWRSDGELLESLGLTAAAAPTNTDPLLHDPEFESRVRSLQALNARHNDMVDRLEEARTEVEVASTAFDYRYIITTPALLPKRALKPKVPTVLGGGLFAAFLLAIGYAVVLDLFSRRIVEPWQVQSALGVPVLGLVQAKSPARRALAGR